MNARLTAMAAAATVLASVALYPLLLGGWFWAGTGAVVVVAVVGAATRLRTLPATVCFLATLAAEFVYLNAVFAHKWSWGGLVPTEASVHHLARLVTQATGQMSRYAPPVPGFPGIVLMAAAGIGLVAVLTDLLAVRLRRPALAGLPLLVLFCVPLTTDARSSWVGTALVFCSGMAGFLGLLSSEGRDRLRLWGRVVRPWQDDSESAGPDTRPLSATGRRIGTTAVVLALCLPLLVPGLKAHRLFPSNGNATPRGYHGTVNFPDPLDELTRQLHQRRALDVLSYRTSAITPPYLQVYVLGRLSDRAWTLAPPMSTVALKHGALPPVPGLNATTPAVTMHEAIHLGAGLRSGEKAVEYLPLPYAARSVNVPGDWRADPNSLTLISVGARLADLNYTVISKDTNPSAQQLRAAPAPPPSLDGYLRVPFAFSKLTRLAGRIVQNRTSLYGKAVALQEWFTQGGRFTYSLNPPPVRGSHALRQFLTKTRRGYCEQFAFAMAVLARLVGIPSRVVVGYTAGTFLGDDTWQVRTSDAHAWPELYFQGAGWLRFEPTPAGEAGQGTATLPAYTTPTGASLPGVAPPTTAPKGVTPSGPAASTGNKGVISKLKHLSPSSGGAKHRRGTALPAALAAIAVLALLLASPRAARSITRQRRWWKASDDAAKAHVAWREVRDDLTDHWIVWRASETPRALGSRLAATLSLAGPERGALERITRAEERATYATSPADPASLRADVTTVRRAVARLSGWRARWSALFAPASALIPVRQAFQRAVGTFGRLDMTLTKAWSQPSLGRKTVSPARG